MADAYLVLVLFQESGGVPDVRKQRKVYPIDPLVVRLPARRSPEANEPATSQLAEAALGVAIFRAVEGDALDRFGRPGHLFCYRTSGGGEWNLIPLGETEVGHAVSKILNRPDLCDELCADVIPWVAVVQAMMAAYFADEKTD